MVKRMLVKEPLRWFLLLWIAMGVVGALLCSNDSTFGSSHIGPPQMLISRGMWVVLNRTHSLSSTFIFLLLAALYSLLLWRGLSKRVQPRFFWLYFLLQGLLVAVMQWMLEEPYLALNFYLVLTLCTVAMFKRTAPALLVGMGCLLLFFVLLVIDIHLETHSAARLLNIWNFSDLA